MFEKQEYDQDIFQQKIMLFNDEIAKKTPWTPLSSGGADFLVYSLKEDREANYYIASTWKFIIYSSMITLYGIITGFIFLIQQNWLSGLKDFSILIPLVFIYIGCYLLIESGKKKIFDFSSQSFYEYVFRKKTNGFKKGVSLRTIHALQIISYSQPKFKWYGVGFGGKYNSYELNIIFNNGDRRYICDFPDRNICQESARKIAQRLSIPVWDMSDILQPQIV